MTQTLKRDASTTDGQDATEHVQAPVAPTRVDRAWERVNSRLRGSRARRRGVAVAGVALAAAATWLLVSLRPSADSQTQTSKVFDEVRAAAAAPLRFEIEHVGEAEVRRLTSDARQIRHRLEHGEAHFDVEPCVGDCSDRPRFVVWAASVRVEVVGTRFNVALEEDQDGPLAVNVRVARGAVSVEGPEASSELLYAGEEARIVLRSPTSVATSPVAEEPSTARQRGLRGRAATVDGAGSVEPAAVTPPHVSDSPPVDNTARALFARAREASRAGQVDAAIERYEALLRTHPRDARAALAAYELGRIWMDQRADLARAAVEFERARTLAPNALLSDDATARLVRIYEGLSQPDRCRRLRDVYLRQFATGRHRNDIMARCP